MGRETLANLCSLYSASGIPPIVRIPSPDPYIACTTLDGGASAILVPYVETVDQVKALVGAAKYRQNTPVHSRCRKVDSPSHPVLHRSDPASSRAQHSHPRPETHSDDS